MAATWWYGCYIVVQLLHGGGTAAIWWHGCYTVVRLLHGGTADVVLSKPTKNNSLPRVVGVETAYDVAVAYQYNTIQYNTIPVQYKNL